MGIFDGAISVFSKIAFRFEFFFPQFIGYFVGQKLKDYKEKGLIEDYKVKAKRRGRYHYLFDVDLFLKIEKGGETVVEEKKGHVKVTVDVEISPSLMDMIKECMENMPQLVQMITEQKKKKE